MQSTSQLLFGGLPLEIIMIIFSFCDFRPMPITDEITVEEAVARVKALSRATRVCRSWYKFITTCPQFWTIALFAFDSNSDAGIRMGELYIRRSVNRVIHLVILSAVCPKRALTDFDCTMDGHWNRVQCLSFRDSCDPSVVASLPLHPRRRQLSLVDLLSQEHIVKSLCRLRIESTKGHTVKSLVPKSPLLVSLTLMADPSDVCRLPSRNAIFPPNANANAACLTSVKLGLAFPTEDVRMFLNQCKALEVFEWMSPDDFLDRGTAPFEVSIPTLRTLQVRNGAVFPVIRSAHLTEVTWDIHLSWIESTRFPRREAAFPVMMGLTHLTACVCTLREDTLRNLLPLIPKLHTITFRTTQGEKNLLLTCGVLEAILDSTSNTALSQIRFGFATKSGTTLYLQKLEAVLERFQSERPDVSLLCHVHSDTLPYFLQSSNQTRVVPMYKENNIVDAMGVRICPLGIRSW